MPIIKFEKINDRASWLLWRIEETLDEMLYALPITRLELNEFDSITNFYKQKEWLAGRLSVKALLDQRNIPYKGVFKDDHGKPFLNNNNHEISIANSYPFAAAIFHEIDPVGIDIENPKMKLRTVAQKFLSTQEQHFAEDNLEKLCIFWCAKETLYKVYGRKQLSFKQNIFIENFDLQKAGTLQGNIDIEDKLKKQYDICYYVLNDLIIAYNL